MFDRIVGVFRLDGQIFEQIEHDRRATRQALLVVLVASLFVAIGTGINATLQGREFLPNFAIALAWSIFSWVLWAGATFLMGSYLLGGRGTFEGLLRTTGFAYAPQAFSIIPCIGAPVGWLWSLACVFVAVRQGMDLSTPRTFFAILVGYALFMLGNIVLSVVFVGTPWLFQ